MDTQPRYQVHWTDDIPTIYTVQYMIDLMVDLIQNLDNDEDVLQMFPKVYAGCEKIVPVEEENQSQQ